jgi:hypothetical protein
LNSGDDVSEEDPTELFDTENVVVCQYDKVIYYMENICMYTLTKLLFVLHVLENIIFMKCPAYSSMTNIVLQIRKNSNFVLQIRKNSNFVLQKKEKSKIYNVIFFLSYYRLVRDSFTAVCENILATHVCPPTVSINAIILVGTV